MKGKTESGPVIAREPAAGKRVTTPAARTQHGAVPTTQAEAPTGDKANAPADEAPQQERLRDADLLEQQKAETDRYKRQMEELQREKAEAVKREKAEAVRQQENAASRQREQEEAARQRAAKEAAEKEALKRKAPPPFVPSF